MSRLESALRRLAEGEFVCAVHYPGEFEVLNDPQGRDKAQAWLEAIGFRLCQLEEGGAFFMGYSMIDLDAKAKVREEMRTLRQRLDPSVRFLETLRQAQGRTAQLQAGDTIAQDELMQAVRTNAGLEQRLNEMRDVHGAKAGEGAGARLERILELLEKDGYLQMANPNHRVFQVTGKIVYLYQLLTFMSEHVPQMHDDGANDQVERQLSLQPADGASSAGAGSV